MKSLFFYKRNYKNKRVIDFEIFEVLWGWVKMIIRFSVLYLGNYYKLYKNDYKIKFICLNFLMSLVLNEIKYNIFWIL